MEREKLELILKKHIDWLNNKEGGERAYLSYADLSSADLSSADLSYANLSSADLRYANLRSANLRSANLSYANLSYANLSSADLSSANLSSANLSSAFVACIIGKKIYQVAGGVGEAGRSLTLLIEKDWKWFIGCFSGTTEELISEINKRHKANKIYKKTCLEAVKYLKKIAKIHGEIEDKKS